MMRIGLAFAIMFAALALLPAPATAASFDCARARKTDEVAVCRNPHLSALDSEMGGLWYAYSRVPMLMGGNGDRMDEAQAFLARRAACGARLPCLAAAYRDRIAELRLDIDRAMAGFRHYVTG
jgi:uncharacterized protein